MYYFKEIRPKDELEQYFRLRYDLYLQTELAPFIPRNAAHIDLDVHDLHSHFYGLYCDEEFVGGLRFVKHKSTLFNADIYALGHRHEIYGESCRDQASLQALDYDDFPFVGYSGETRASYESWRANHPCYEAGRVVIRAEHRRSKLAQFIVECAIVMGMIHSGDRIGMGVTFAAYDRAYRRYGFDYIGPTERYQVHGVRLSGLVARLSRRLSNGSTVPEHLHSIFEARADEFAATGKIGVAL